MGLKQNARRVWWNGRRVYVKIPPRTGRCSRCGAVGVRTNMHHRKIGKTPLAFTEELCLSCHLEEHLEDGNVPEWMLYQRRWRRRRASDTH